MGKLNIPTKMSRSFHKFGLKMKKHSPEIMVVTGVVGLVASAVLACKASTRLNAVLEEHKDKMEKLNEIVTAPDATEEYTEKDISRLTGAVYVQTGMEFVKMYGPSVVLGAASITSILVGHNILRKRNMALAAAYTVIDKSFKDYRERVVERFGKELDRELRYNIKSQEVEEIVVDEKGKEKVVKKTVSVIDPNSISDYARIWYEGNPGWTKDPEYNMMYLKNQQSYANDLLQTRGHLFLNEVYDMLGFSRTKAGNVVGWIYDEEAPIGDNFVDFGIFDIHNEAKIKFVNGEERSIMLDFNVDGNILDMM